MAVNRRSAVVFKDKRVFDAYSDLMNFCPSGYRYWTSKFFNLNRLVLPEDKKLYLDRGYLHNCFNCIYFSSLSSDVDFCKYHKISRLFNDDVCESFQPYNIPWFFEE